MVVDALSRFASAGKSVRLLPAALCLLGVGLLLGIYPYQADDAFITYRYAGNLAAGRGLVFNPGGPPVEGFSSPAWLLLLAAGAWLFGAGALPLLAFLLGVGVWLLGFFALLERDDADRAAQRFSPPGLVAAALYTLGPAVLFYAASGLESVLFLLLVVLFARATAGSLAPPWGLAAAAAALWVRPEGAWLLPMLLVQAWVQDGGRCFGERRYRRLAGALVAGGVALLALRLALFHSLLPNTYWAKPPDHGAGLRYLLEYLGSPWGATLLLLAALGAWLGGRRRRGYFLAGLAWLPAVVLEGGDWMPAGRMLLPAFALFMLAASGIFPSAAGAAAQTAPATRRWRAFGALLLLAALAAGGVAVRNQTRAARRALTQAVRLEESLSVWVRRSGARSAAAVDIGRFGFYGVAEVVDLAGLTDPVIGRAPGRHLQKRFDPGYLFDRRRPDLIVIKVAREPVFLADGRMAMQVRSPVENLVMTDARMAERYRFVQALLPAAVSETNIGKLIFARRGFALPAGLTASPVIRLR